MFRAVIVKKVSFCLAGGFWLIACSDEPSRARFPGGHGRTTDVAQAQTTRGVLGGFDPMSTQLPGSQMVAKTSGSRPRGDVDLKDSETIRGEIVLGPKVRVREGDFVFIAARPADGGPPLAAQRHRGLRFPYKFSLSKRDSMMADTPFEGAVEITVRLDQDGDPISRQKGDYLGSFKTRVGEQNAKILVETEVQGD